MALASFYPGVPAAVEALASAAGDNPDNVAKLLGDLNIRAVCGDADSCAIADWLNTVTDSRTVTGIEVYPADPSGRAYVSWADITSNYVYADCDLPPVLNAFALRFDERKYPDLID